MDVNFNLLMQIILNVPNYVFWKDKQLVYRGCNINFAHSLGFNSVDEVIGKSDSELGWLDSFASVYVAEDRQIIATGQPILNTKENSIGQ